jgi:hypothetical protein
VKTAQFNKLPAVKWLTAHGFRVKDASGPNGTYKNLRDFDRRTIGDLLSGGSHRVTAQAIGAEGQDGYDTRVTAQAIGAESQS